MDITHFVANVPFDERSAKLCADANLTCLDILTLGVEAVAQRTRLSILDARALIAQVQEALAPEVTPGDQVHPSQFTTGDAGLDKALNGGISTRTVTEVCGEAGVGKSTFALQLCVCVQLPRLQGGLGRRALHISTEGGWSTQRLLQIASDRLSQAGMQEEDVLQGVDSVECLDDVTEHNLIAYGLEPYVERRNVGLIVLDSLAANQTAESMEHKPQTTKLNERRRHFISIANALRCMALKHDIAVVIVNQVRQAPTVAEDEDVDYLSLHYQNRFIGAPLGPSVLRSFGSLAWSNCIHARLFLVRARQIDPSRDDVKRAYLDILFGPDVATGRHVVYLGPSGFFTEREDGGQDGMALHFEEDHG